MGISSSQTCDVLCLMNIFSPPMQMPLNDLILYFCLAKLLIEEEQSCYSHFTDGTETLKEFARCGKRKNCFSEQKMRQPE